ncbi:membrane protein [Mycobacterium phage Roscoe]|uniref:Uncharacterized protein n=1 Tax=Mycobacterium phage ShiVal TaxID=1296647 RepID=M4W8S5_9CAUD|nr:gp44 [Mycobacterium phage ShiVal]AGI13049.1 hypothetical protein SHIVAL_44 [Mycobacterium phage ShiVal]AZS09856.1 membrane protein [Mycobacterium phage Roscoe]
MGRAVTVQRTPHGGHHDKVTTAGAVGLFMLFISYLPDNPHPMSTALVGAVCIGIAVRLRYLGQLDRTTYRPPQPPAQHYPVGARRERITHERRTRERIWFD